jgi:large subunit ribosomal protein L25
MTMSEHLIQASRRDDQGKGASRRLRRAGAIPAVVYGAHAAPESVQLDHEKTWLVSQNEWFYSSILTLDVDGTAQKVLLRDLQRHPYRQQIMHLDFQRISENEALRAKVPLHFVNQESSPAGKAAAVVITHELNEVTVSCLPKDLPEFIAVDLANLAVGDVVHLSEIQLPAGVELPELKLGKEHDVAVVIAKHARVEEEPVEVPAAVEVPASKVTKKDDEKK